MQAVRSRAGNLRSCQCQTWPRISTSSARLTTTSAPSRRKILASDVFTACYTGIMATAAVLDAGRKDKRRKDLDDRLDKAKNELAALMERSASSDLAQIIKDAHLYPDSLLSGPSRNWSREQVLLKICQLNPQTIETIQRRVWIRRAASLEPRTEGQLPWYDGDTQLGLVECADMLASEEKYHMKEREPRTTSHFESTGRMFSELVDQLLFTAYSTMPTQTRRPATALDSAFNMIRMVRSDGYPRYTHPKLDCEATAAARFQLNEVNRRIIAGWDPRQKDKLVAKICYNILVSKVPPGIKNYNALISGFTEVREHELAQVVVDSFLHKSQLRPTKATALCLLHHYRLKGDVVGFQNTLQRMTGFDPRGLGLRRRRVGEEKNDWYLQGWMRRSKSVQSHGYVVQPVGLCGHTCEVILQGLVDFGMLKEAARFFIGCLKDGLAVGATYTQRLLDSCIGNMHRMAVKILIDGFLCHLRQAGLMLFERDDQSLELSRRVRYLLNIAWATWYRLPHGVCRQSQAPITSLPRKQSSMFVAHIRALGTLTWAEELSSFLEAVNDALIEVEETLCMKIPLLDRLAAADYSVERMLALHYNLRERSKSASRMGEHTRLRLERRFSADRIKGFERELVSALSRPAPFSAVDVHSVPVENWIVLYRDLRDPDSSASRLTRCFEQARSIDKDLRAVLVDLVAAICPLGDIKQQYSSETTEDMELTGLFEAALELLRARRGEVMNVEANEPGDTLAPWVSVLRPTMGSPSKTWGKLNRTAFAQGVGLHPCQG